jgi:soluble lytic murein transglycosylase-like protein
VLGLALAYVVLINGLVRHFGGDPHLLSPLHIADKTVALGQLARHALDHAMLEDHPVLHGAVIRAAQRHGVPPDLALAIARTESGFDPHAISRTGAMGLMQLMPSTAAMLEVDDPFDPRDNADGAARYLRTLLARYGADVRRAVAAYNAGPGRVPRSGPLRLPPETRHYQRAVLGSMPTLRLLR